MTLRLKRVLGSFIERLENPRKIFIERMNLLRSTDPYTSCGFTFFVYVLNWKE
jgi:hypothetical protein